MNPSERDDRDSYWEMASRYPKQMCELIEHIGYPFVRKLFAGRPDITEPQL